MSREEVIRLSYAASNGSLTSSDISILLMNYYMENGKPYFDSSRFVISLGKVPELLAYCISYTLKWYERKYAINKLYSAPNPMALGDGRRIILIY